MDDRVATVPTHVATVVLLSHGGDTMARRRRKRGSPLSILLVLAPVALGAWWLYSLDQSPGRPEQTVPPLPKPLLTTDRPEIVAEPNLRPDVPEKGSNPKRETAAAPEPPAKERIQQLVGAGRQAVSKDDPVAARAYFSEAMQLGINGDDATFLKAELTRIGNETILSGRIFDNDPFVTRYVVEAGDTLGKIASKYKVSPELLARINGLRSMNMIRLGQSLKIIKGPFRAIVDKQSFSLDVYLDQTFVRHYKSGLGTDGSTPTGEWRVSTKLVNPTYYPPRGGQIVAADDPENPLGERWIGLIGIDGEAVGQLRYGIHGTIEPESIGQNASLGCIRLYNEDVEELYTFLVEKHSTVTIR